MIKLLREIFFLIGASTLTLSGIYGAILAISWPKRPVPIKEMDKKWKIALIVLAALVGITVLMALALLILWIISLFKK